MDTKGKGREGWKEKEGKWKEKRPATIRDTFPHCQP